MVELSEASVESFADFPALERARSSVDGQFSESGREIKSAAAGSEALRGCILVEESLGLASDEVDVGAESSGSEAVLDELCGVSMRESKVSLMLQLLTFFCSMSLELGQS